MQTFFVDYDFIFVHNICYNQYKKGILSFY